MKKFLEKIQNLPENKKKIILWAVVVLLGLLIFGWYFTNMKLVPIDKAKLQEDLKIDELKEDLNNVPKIELPKF